MLPDFLFKVTFPVGLCSGVSFGGCVPLWWTSLASPAHLHSSSICQSSLGHLNNDSFSVLALFCLALQLWVQAFTPYTQFLGKSLLQEGFGQDWDDRRVVRIIFPGKGKDEKRSQDPFLNCVGRLSFSGVGWGTLWLWALMGHIPCCIVKSGSTVDGMTHSISHQVLSIWFLSPLK